MRCHLLLKHDDLIGCNGSGWWIGPPAMKWTRVKAFKSERSDDNSVREVLNLKSALFEECTSLRN